MEFKLINSETNKEVFAGESLTSSNTERLAKKKYKVKIKTKDGEVIEKYTDFIDFSDNGKIIHMEGMKVEGFEKKNIK